MDHKENKPNTKFSYLYRDAGNWKQYQDIVARGTLTESQVAKIFSACGEAGNFITDDVGFPEKRFDRITLEDDHIWFTLLSVEPTDEEASDERSAEEVFLAFVNARWDEAAAKEF